MTDTSHLQAHKPQFNQKGLREKHQRERVQSFDPVTYVTAHRGIRLVLPTERHSQPLGLSAVPVRSAVGRTCALSGYVYVLVLQESNRLKTQPTGGLDQS